MKGLRILLVDDEPLMRLSMVDALETIGHDVEASASGTEGIEAIRQRPFDLVITDLRLPGADGLTVLTAAKKQSPHTEVMVITAHGSVETAVGAMKLGAFDYITKPFQMDELLLIVERVGRVVTLRRENQDLKAVLEDKFSFGGILGANNHMRAVLEKIKLVAGTDSTTLILGESGTGKELVANAIHQNSARSHYPLIKVSCAALPETLLEAELFGHEKGAFTGALRQRRGRFELAHRGTLFLDEIGEISPVVQVKLLRVLQERQFERVGGNDRIDVDVRLVCATQKDLRKEVSQGRFREDLFYRLNVVHVVNGDGPVRAERNRGRSPGGRAAVERTPGEGRLEVAPRRPRRACGIGSSRACWPSSARCRSASGWTRGSVASSPVCASSRKRPPGCSWPRTSRRSTPKPGASSPR